MSNLYGRCSKNILKWLNRYFIKFICLIKVIRLNEEELIVLINLDGNTTADRKSLKRLKEVSLNEI